MSDHSVSIVETRSGALAVVDHSVGEVMHPVIGPRVESEALYVRPSRLCERLSTNGDPLVLFDVGLGAGSNAAAAWTASEQRTTGRRLQIVSFDRKSAALELAACGSQAAAFGYTDVLAGAARSLLDTGMATGRRTTWHLVLGELPQALCDTFGCADIVFWDPFSPRVNPELWTVAAFTALRQTCRAGVTLHTYSASTAVRAALLLAGFSVGRGPGIAAKAQTTTAAWAAEDLEQPLGPRFLSRLRRSSAPLPPDAPLDALCQIEGAAQFR